MLAILVVDKIYFILISLVIIISCGIKTKSNCSVCKCLLFKWLFVTSYHGHWKNCFLNYCSLCPNLYLTYADLEKIYRKAGLFKFISIKYFRNYS